MTLTGLPAYSDAEQASSAVDRCERDVDSRWPTWAPYPAPPFMNAPRTSISYDHTAKASKDASEFLKLLGRHIGPHVGPFQLRVVEG